MKSMISDPNLVLLICISKGTTILAKYTTGGADLDLISQKCIEDIPPFHSFFTHTSHRRTYSFVINHPFTYFAISDQNLAKVQVIWLLDRIQDAFIDIIESNSGKKEISDYCFQGEVTSIISLLFKPLLPLPPGLRTTRDISLGSWKGSAIVSVPLLEKPGKGAKKKKRFSSNNSEDFFVENKSVVKLSVEDSSSKDLMLFFHERKIDAEEKWMRHVRMVLILDLVLCSSLFCIWLYICDGFQCVNG